MNDFHSTTYYKGLEEVFTPFCTSASRSCNATGVMYCLHFRYVIHCYCWALQSCSGHDSSIVFPFVVIAVSKFATYTSDLASFCLGIHVCW
jgi:hypothetical protein